MADSGEQRDKIIALDHTKLRDRPKRIWNFGDIALPGLYLPSLYSGAATFGVGILATLLLAQLPIGGPVVLFGLLASVALAIGVGAAWGRFKPDGMTPSQWLWVAFDFRTRQPRLFHGFSEDTEAKTLHWKVILWVPYDDPYAQRPPAPDAAAITS